MQQIHHDFSHSPRLQSEKINVDHDHDLYDHASEIDIETPTSGNMGGIGSNSPSIHATAIINETRAVCKVHELRIQTSVECASNINSQSPSPISINVSTNSIANINTSPFEQQPMDRARMIDLLKLITKLSVLVIASVVTTWLALLSFGYILPSPGAAIEGWLNALCALYCFDFHHKKYYCCCKLCDKWMYRCCQRVVSSRIRIQTPFKHVSGNNQMQIRQ